MEILHYFFQRQPQLTGNQIAEFSIGQFDVEIMTSLFRSCKRDT